MRSLLIVLLAASALNAQELSTKEVEALLARLSASRAGAAMQADFREERRLALMNKPVIETGTVSFLPPDKFRRQVDDGTLTLCDGDVLWLYYPQFGEAEKYTLSSNRSLRESLAAMTSGFGLQNLGKNYNVPARKTANGYRATLTPKTSSLRKAVAEIQVDISSELSAKRLEIVGAEGDRTLVTFSNERRVNLSPQAFEFQPPQGVRVSEPLR
ncbi:MAG TPA: outer membrane lipoprotein carrier protein LolA [Terrimicrobiaceae bacterium]|nr:outer membrane lipoprotein carrier protein LolA [Terrimicrobiaceae bacterium]